MNNNIYYRFERLSMGDKLIDNIPGITQSIKKDFNNIGFKKAYHLLGQYLLFDKNNELFDEWLVITIPQMTLDNRQKCIMSLYEWTNNNL